MGDPDGLTAPRFLLEFVTLSVLLVLRVES